MKICVVEDEDILRISISDDLKEAGFHISSMKSPTVALKILIREEFDVALIDYKMPEMDGIHLLKKVKQMQPHCAVIIMTAFGTIQTAVVAMKEGAYDYITKPFSNEELILALKRIQEVQSLKQENIELKKQLSERHGFHALIGKSQSMQQIYNLLEIVATSNSTVLITGETGSGKEMVADAIHYLGPRQNGPFKKVSCALFSKEILRVSFSVMKRGHSRERFPPRREGSNWPTRALCSWTMWMTFLSRFKLSFLEFSRAGNSNASEGPKQSKSMLGSWPLQKKTSWARQKRGNFERTCITG